MLRCSEYFVVQFAVARPARIADTTLAGRPQWLPGFGIGVQQG